jgi:Xylanase inhibitor C-terminal/Xylanase inhibitor N-terminal
MATQLKPLDLITAIVLSISLLTLFFPLTLTLTLTLAQQPKVNALVAPITKDASTSLYTIALNSTKQFLIDLAGPIVWSPCPASYSLVHCTAPICNEANSFGYPDCLPETNNGTNCFCKCVSSTKNPVTGACFTGDEALIGIYIASTDGKNPTASVSADYVNICAPVSALAGLPPGAVGGAGFGRTSLVSLPSRLAWDLSFNNQFVLCLPSSTDSHGVAFFGPKPYFLLPPNRPDISNILSYTTLLKSPNYYDAAYYLNVNGLAINQKSVSIKGNDLNFDSAGNGGVMLSTTIPYTVMRTDIYKPFFHAYKKATKGIPNMPAVQPFELCFDTRALSSTRVGYGVPSIDIVLYDGKNWTIFGANSIKDVMPNTACLAFVDGGKNQKTAITLGGFQMEDSFLLFDVPNSTLGFIPTLRGIQTTCSNFNFTSGGY